MARKPRLKKTPIQKQLEDYTNMLEVIELAAHDPYVTDQRLSQVGSGGYVEFGEGDNQFNYLLNMYNGSPTHGAIVNSLSRMVYGNGLNVEGIIDPKDNKRVVKDFNIFGNAVLQVTATDIFHISTPTVRAQELNPETGEIDGYFISSDFEDASIEKVWYPAWKEGWKPTKEYPSAIYYIRTYTPQAFFYGLPDFQSGLSFMEQEISVAAFLVDYVNNNFSVTTVVSFNNGVTDPETRLKMKQSVEKRLTGANGKKVIVAFTKGSEYAPTIQNIEISNASEQYEYMTRNARSNIIVSHNIVTPTLVGVRDDSVGFSSNADEMVKGRIILEETKVEPQQLEIADAYNVVRGRTDVAYISSLDLEDETVKEEETVELKKANPVLNTFVGMGVENIEGYKLIHKSKMLDEAYNKEVKEILREFEGESIALASSGTANTLKESEADKEGFIVRYRYDGNPSPERDFCRTMMQANRLYREEDIKLMGTKNVNPGFGMHPTPNKPYSIWEWQGGGLLSPNAKTGDSYPFGTCKHFWTMEVYAVEQHPSGNVKKINKRISNAVAIRNGMSPLKNPKQTHTSNHSQRK